MQVKSRRASQGVIMRLPMTNVLIAVAVVLSNVYRVAERQDPALLPGSQWACSPASTAHVYASWPARECVPAKLAFAARNFGTLFAHITPCHWPWAVGNLWHLGVATAAVVVAWKQPQRSAGGVSAVALVLALAVYPVLLAVCSSASPEGGAAHPFRGQCPPSTSAQVFTQVAEELFGLGWPLGVATSALLLPPAWHLLAATGQCLVAVMVLALQYARYPAASAAAGHGAVPLDWRALAGVILQREFLLSLCRCIVGCIVLPVLLTLARERMGWSRVAGAGADADAARRRGAAAKLRGGGGAGAEAAERDGKGAAAMTAFPESPQQPEAAAAGSGRRGSLAEAVQRLQARQAAAGVAPPKSCHYTSCVRRSAVVVKVAMDGEVPGGREALTAAMRAAVSTAVRNAAAAAAAAGEVTAPPQPPMLQSFAAFPGCFCAVAEVVGCAELLEASIAAELATLLPAQARLLSVKVASLQEQQREEADGVWCDPVALPAGEGAATATAVLPAPLLARLAASGSGLRVVVAAGTHGAPFADFTLRPDQATWPHDGRVRVALPCDAGPLVQLTLLRAPAATSDHGADALLMALPILVLPGGACEEARQLWHDMCLAEAEWAQLPPDAAAAMAAPAAFAAQWLPFALDFGLVLEHGRVHQHALAPSADLRALMEERGMRTCARALAAAVAPAPGQTSAGGAGAAAEIGSVTGGLRVDAVGPPPRALSPPWAAARAVLLGFGGSQERAYVSWKGEQLLAWDTWAMRCDRMRFIAVLVFLAVFTVAVHRAHGILFLCLQSMAMIAIMVPGWVRKAAPQGYYVRSRGWLVAGCTFASAFMTALLPIMCGQMEAFWHLAVTVPRPFMYIFYLTTILPVLQQLDVCQQAVASAGAFSKGVLLHLVVYGDPLVGRVLLWVAVSMGIAAVGDWRHRRQWLLHRDAKHA